MKLISCFCLFITIFCTNIRGNINLEEDVEPFVLETKRIHIPGHPDAFNAGIIRWQGRLLLSFRVIPDPKMKYNSRLGLVWLNDDFEPVGTPQILETHEPGFPVAPRSEDARLLTVGDKLYIVYSDNKEEKLSKGGFRVYVGQLTFDGEKFSVHAIECLSKYEGETRNLREKNWVPFDYEGQLLLAYSLSPHRIFRPLLDSSGQCETVAISEKPIDWDWGELRGGTPGLLDDGAYLSFFHSWKDMSSIHSENKTVSHYFMGAYIFSPSPPFEITAISPKPIIGKGFYTGQSYKPYWKPVKAIFPCGFVFDDHFIWVAYGRDDHEIWIVKLNKKGLLGSLRSLTRL